MGIKFRYLLDPLFLIALVIYSTNKSSFLGLHFSSYKFCTCHLNDLLLVPVAIPIILSFSRILKLRAVYSPPRFLEIIWPLTIWSIAFELIGPFYFGKGISDYVDVFAYCLGGLISWIIWNRGELFYGLVNRRFLLRD